MPRIPSGDDDSRRRATEQIVNWRDDAVDLFPSVFSAASRQRTRHPVSFRFINSPRLAGGTPAALNRSFQSSLRVSRECGLFQSGPRCLETFSIPRSLRGWTKKQDPLFLHLFFHL